MIPAPVRVPHVTLLGPLEQAPGRSPLHLDAWMEHNKAVQCRQSTACNGACQQRTMQAGSGRKRTSKHALGAREQSGHRCSAAQPPMHPRTGVEVHNAQPPACSCCHSKGKAGMGPAPDAKRCRLCLCLSPRCPGCSLAHAWNARRCMCAGMWRAGMLGCVARDMVVTRYGSTTCCRPLRCPSMGGTRHGQRRLGHSHSLFRVPVQACPAHGRHSSWQN